MSAPSAGKNLWHADWENTWGCSHAEWLSLLLYPFEKRVEEAYKQDFLGSIHSKMVYKNQSGSMVLGVITIGKTYRDIIWHINHCQVMFYPIVTSLSSFMTCESKMSVTKLEHYCFDCSWKICRQLDEITGEEDVVLGITRNSRDDLFALACSEECSLELCLSEIGPYPDPFY
jgi:hypothetical protein